MQRTDRDGCTARTLRRPILIYREPATSHEGLNDIGPQDFREAQMISPNLARISSKDEAASPAVLQVDIIADLVCPWCYLGKRRLDDALLAVHGPSSVNWYPFQLNPAMPETGMGFNEYLASRFGEPEALRPALEQLAKAGAAEGVNFR